VNGWTIIEHVRCNYT